MPIQKPDTCKKEDPCWKCRGFVTQSSCPLKKRYKQWARGNAGGEAVGNYLNSTERIEPVDPVERDETKEVKEVQKVSETDDLKNEAMPPIQHPECYAPDCDQPRVKSPRATATGGYMLVCEGHSHDKSAKIKAGWNRKKERDAVGLAPARPAKKTPAEARADSAHVDPAQPVSPVSGGGQSHAP